MSDARRDTPWTAATLVRRLLERLEAPHAALHRIMHAPERHLALLLPRLTVLDAAPFKALPSVHTVGNEPPAEQTPRPRHFTDLLERMPARTPASQRPRLGDTATRSASRPRPTLQPGSAAQPGSAPRERVAAPVLPLSTQRHSVSSIGALVGADGSAARETAVSSHSEQGQPGNTSLAPPAGAPATHGTIADGSAAEAGRAPPMVDLGTLVERVQRAQQALRAARSGRAPNHMDPRDVNAHMASAPAWPQSRPAAAGIVPRFALPVSATRAVNGAVFPAAARGHGSLADASANAPASAARPVPYHDAAPRPDRSAPVFFFNPLEPRPPADDEDALEERIADVLREQARRHGVDLT